MPESHDEPPQTIPSWAQFTPGQIPTLFERLGIRGQLLELYGRWMDDVIVTNDPFAIEDFVQKRTAVSDGWDVNDNRVTLRQRDSHGNSTSLKLYRKDGATCIIESAYHLKGEHQLRVQATIKWADGAGQGMGFSCTELENMLGTGWSLNAPKKRVRKRDRIMAAAASFVIVALGYFHKHR